MDATQTYLRMGCNLFERPCMRHAVQASGLGTSRISKGPYATCRRQKHHSKPSPNCIISPVSYAVANVPSLARLAPNDPLLPPKHARIYKHQMQPTRPARVHHLHCRSSNANLIQDCSESYREMVKMFGSWLNFYKS